MHTGYGAWSVSMYLFGLKREGVICMVSKMKSQSEAVKQFTLKTIIGDFVVIIKCRTVIALMRPNDVGLYLDKLGSIRPQPVVDVSFCSDLDAMETALRVREVLGCILGSVPEFMKYVYTYAGLDTNAAFYAEKRPALDYVAKTNSFSLKEINPMDEHSFLELKHLCPQVDCIPLSGEPLGLIQNSLFNFCLSYSSSSPPRLMSYAELACLSHPDLSEEQGVKYTRAAATAMSKNPVLFLVPCHMVISKPLYDDFIKAQTHSQNALLKDPGKYRLDPAIKAFLMRRYGINVKMTV